MDWQTLTTILILAFAAAILLNRGWAFLRSGKKGDCGSCGGCCGSSKSTELLQLVHLGTGENSQKNAAGSQRSADVVAEKSG